MKRRGRSTPTTSSTRWAICERGPTIDTARLADWMDGAALPGKGEPLEARFLSGGTQNVIYELTPRRADVCVLRMPPPGAPPDRDKGILREWRIIEALDGTDVPHTAAVGVCPDASVLGRPFYLMGFVDGWSPMDLARRVAGAVRQRPRRARRAVLPTGRGHRAAVQGRLEGQGTGTTSAAPTASTNAKSTAGPPFSNGSRAARSTASTSRPNGCATTGRSTSSPA